MEKNQATGNSRLYVWSKTLVDHWKKTGGTLLMARRRMQSSEGNFQKGRIKCEKKKLPTGDAPTKISDGHQNAPRRIIGECKRGEKGRCGGISISRTRYLDKGLPQSVVGRGLNCSGSIEWASFEGSRMIDIGSKTASRRMFLFRAHWKKIEENTGET